MLIPFVYLATIYNQLPETVPFHYGYDGQPDRYGPKSGLTLLFGGLTVLMYFMFRYLPKLDPKQNLNSTHYLKIRLLITVFWSILLVFLWYTSTQGVMGETFLSCLLAGVFLLLAGIGNLLYSVKPNYFVGIRTPWTLENETVWRKTHQWAAPVWVVGGLVPYLRSSCQESGNPLSLLMNLLRPSVQPYMISWMKYDPVIELKKFKGPVLLIQGKRDGQVAVSEAELLKAARSDAPLLLFDNMTHVLKDAADATPQANLKTYKDPTQPLTSGLAKAIANFVKKK